MFCKCRFTCSRPLFLMSDSSLPCAHMKLHKFDVHILVKALNIKSNNYEHARLVIKMTCTAEQCTAFVWQQQKLVYQVNRHAKDKKVQNKQTTKQQRCKDLLIYGLVFSPNKRVPCLMAAKQKLWSLGCSCYEVVRSQDWACWLDVSTFFWGIPDKDRKSFCLLSTIRPKGDQVARGLARSHACAQRQHGWSFVWLTTGRLRSNWLRCVSPCFISVLQS